MEILIAVRRVPAVSYHYNDEVKLIYLTSAKGSNSSGSNEDGETEIYIPMTTFNDIDLHTIQTIQQVLGNDKQHQRNVIIGIVDSNSSILYYRMTDGLVDLDQLLMN